MSRHMKRTHPSPVAKVTQDILERYKLIRALHACYYTRVLNNIDEFSPEFFYLVGDVLEGRAIDEERLRYIDMDRVRRFLKEER